jgi:hypothetical protein
MLQPSIPNGQKRVVLSEAILECDPVTGIPVEPGNVIMSGDLCRRYRVVLNNIVYEDIANPSFLYPDP